MTAKKRQTTATRVASVVSIPGYEIKDLLGRGGMAMVYLAVQKSIGREVALKVLSPDHNDDSFSERFLREAKIASQLAHSNIITIFDAGIHNDIHYMSMEYIKGKNFNEARDLLSRKQKIIIIKEIAQALDFASRKGFVHRDIKPENILLHQDGRAILTDFGIAKTSDVSKGLTETGKILGTPYFMSPEQTKGLKIDHRTDIYSLGVVLFQALAGYVPYDGPSLVSICIKHLSDPIPQLPKGLEIFQPIINTCMSKKPEHRYQYGSELYQALEQISASQLDKIEAEAKAFKQAGSNTNARTILDTSPITTQAKNIHASTSSATSTHQPVKRNLPTHGYIRTKQSTFITESEDFKKLGRRKRTIIILILFALTATGYYKKQELITLWFTQGSPLAEKYLPTDITQYIPLAHKKNEKPIVKIVTPIKSPLDIENEKIQVLKTSLNKIPANAKKLAQIYSDRLLIAPNDNQVIADIQTLKNWYFKRIASLINTKNFITASKSLEQLLLLYPDLDQNEEFSQLQNKLRIGELNEPFLQKSRVYFAVNALIKPDGANALEQLKIVQRNDPTNEEVQIGLAKIAEHFKAKAIQEYSNKQNFKALDSINSAIQAISNDTELLALQHEIKSAINNTQDLNIILKKASKLNSDGFSIHSNKLGENAYDLYQQVLLSDKNNKTAINSLKRIHSQILKTASIAIQQNRFLDAKLSLDKAISLYQQSAKLKTLRKQLQTEMDAVLPIIPRIKISNVEFTEINQTNLQKIKIGQLLYVGFKYKNFTQDETILTVNIYNGTPSKLILQKSMTITGKEGIHYFSIQLPSKGITSGDYSIELLLGESRLIKANLFGIH